MTILGLGTDIIEIDRIAKAMERAGPKFLERILTESERAYCLGHGNPLPRIAGRWAAKEAAVKALGLGFGTIGFLDVEILLDDKGAPLLTLHGEALRLFPKEKMLISISHCKEYAVATAIRIQ